MVGLKVQIVSAVNKQYLSIKGTILEDTRNMLLIKTGKGAKKVPKLGCTFMIDNGKEEVIVEGKDIQGRIDERLKK